MERRKLSLIAIIPIALWLLSSCMPVLRRSTIPTHTTTQPSLPPSDSLTPTGTPTPASLATPPPAEEYQATAWASLGRPGWGSVQTVFGKLTKGGERVAQAQMYSIVHDEDADHRWPREGYETTNSDGIASVSFVVVDTSADYIIHADVYLIHEGMTYRTSTSFAPQC